MRESANYIDFTSGATAGRQNGEEIWIPSDNVCIQGKAITVNPTFFTVVHAEPSVLLLHARLGPTQVYLLAAHAPPSSAKVRGKRWWEKLRRLVRDKVPRGFPLLAGIDANGRVGGERLPIAGGHQPEAQDAPGNSLLDLCEQSDTILPQTFLHCHTGPGWTWQSRGGAVHRIDYIIWPAQWQTGHVGTSVHYDADISSGSIDHKLVTCIGMAAGGTSPQDVRWRSVPYDRNRVARVPESRLLTALLDWAPQLPWRAHPSDSMAVWS